MSVRDSDFDNVDPGEPRILVPPGKYPARCASYESRQYVFGGKIVEKLIMSWEVFISLHSETGTILQRFYNLQRNKANQFQFGALSAFRKDWVAANRGRPPSDRRKLPPSKFQEGRCLVQVVTVDTDCTGRHIKGLEWSRINAVLGRIDDNETLAEPFEQAG